MQKHWLAASFKMEPRKMLHGELVHPQWSYEIVRQKQASAWRRWLAVKQGVEH